VGNRRIAQELEKGALYGLNQLYIFMYSLYWAQVRVFPIGSNRKKGRLKKKYMCVYCHRLKKSRVGRLALIFFFIKLSAKPEIVVPGSGIRYFIFEISGKPSFVETVL
jgi:hypothetical protein